MNREELFSQVRAKQISQAEASRRLGISRQAVNQAYRTKGRNTYVVLRSNLHKAAKIMGVTPGDILRSLAKSTTHFIIKDAKASFVPIQWDGTAKGADYVLRHMPDGTVATTGGARGYRAELHLQSKRGRKIGEAKKGDWIGLDGNGNACIVR